MGRYAVLDLETTGFSPAHHDRVVEVAVVIVDDEGGVVREWDTLLNPERDVGPSEVHGLTAGNLRDAPLFAEVAGELASLLSGRVLVAHNLSFDAPFVAAEFARAGHPVPLERTSGLCTMRLASHYLPDGPRTLEACCESIGCGVESAHAALEDARATARLLGYYMQADDDFLGYWSEVIRAAQGVTWPTIPSSEAVRVSRRDVAARRPQHFLGRLACRMPRCEVHPEANSYLTLLDRALLDRRISLSEEDELVAAAQMMGLSREDAESLHRTYLRALARIALEDGVATPDEHADLATVARALGLPDWEAPQALAEADSAQDGACEVGTFCLKPGDVVVFTGQAPGMDRADLEYQALSLGLRAAGAVSGKTSLVVAADPDSLSGKARKARNLGIPIVDYPSYLLMLDSVI